MSKLLTVNVAQYVDGRLWTAQAWPHQHGWTACVNGPDGFGWQGPWTAAGMARAVAYGVPVSVVDELGLYPDDNA
jgi:hypothetical protein